MQPLASHVVGAVRDAADRQGLVVALTGAGISAASGIPTFRGAEGWWTAGSVRYTPQELATARMFGQAPDAVWTWYLRRLAIGSKAAPNPAHHALVDAERALGDRFLLVTQNVDGLHRRAGSVRVYEIHGSLDAVRCADGCTPGPWPLPEQLAQGRADGQLGATDRAALTCPGCGGWLRPNVLWFDEAYDEARYRLDSTIAAAEQAALLLVVGTSGATTLPALAVRVAAQAGATIVDVNPEENALGVTAREAGGVVIRAQATDALPPLVDVIAGGRPDAHRSGEPRAPG